MFGNLQRLALVVWLLMVLTTVPLKAAQYVRLPDLAASYGFAPPYGSGKQIVLRSKWTTMVFETNSRKFMVDGLLIWMHAPLQFQDGSWVLTQTDVREVINPLLRSHAVLGSAGGRVVILDPGHGGTDKGASSAGGLREKEVALDLAKRVRNKLRSTALTVRMTREKDRYVGLSARSEKATRWKADVFVSIHVNSASDKTVSGFETYVLTSPGFGSTAEPGRVAAGACTGNRYNESSMVLGFCLQRNILACTRGTDRGVKHAGFLVLKNVPCPSALVECGFVSNPKDTAKMVQSQYLDQVAEGIARGVQAYLSKVNAAHYSTGQ